MLTKAALLATAIAGSDVPALESRCAAVFVLALRIIALLTAKWSWQGVEHRRANIALGDVSLARSSRVVNARSARGAG